MIQLEKAGKPALLLLGLLAVLLTGAPDTAAAGGDQPTATNSLIQNDRLDAGSSLSSANGAFRLYMQGDGNLVLRDSTGSAVWSSATSGTRATRLNMQSDGNLVLRDSTGSAVWSSGTSRSGADRLVLNNDGSLAVYARSTPVWAVNGDGETGGNAGGAGTITRHVWTNISGTSIAALTDNADYPGNPDRTDELTSFEAPTNWGDNYGTRVVGYVHAPVSGPYTFWIASDDDGELWLSTNDSASNKRQIAYMSGWSRSREWDKRSHQESATITLAAGQRYYIEALQKEGGGGDNLSVAWQTPNGPREVIPGAYLSPYQGEDQNAGEAGAYTIITSPADGLEVSPDEAVTVTVDAFDPDGLDVARLWLNGNYHDIDQTAPFEFTLTNLPEGDHTLMVRTKDQKGNSLDSEPVSISVKNNQPFTIITSPANGTIVTAGESFTVQASAFDPDGVQATRLWINGSYHSLDSNAPFAFTVDGLTEGTHSLVVRSKNTNGTLMDSEAVSITVLADNSGNDGDSNTGGGATGESWITLPIEVFGPSGAQESVTFNLNDPSNVTHLYLRCNACGYHDIRLDKITSKVKATVRVNGGSAIPLKHFTENGRVYGNGDIDIIGGEADYGGIGGGFRTVRMTVPISGLVKGENTLTFEHKDAEAPSIGFRIIELNLLENGRLSRKVLNDTAFVLDDPSYWTPPRDSSRDIAEGRDLWHQNNILYDPWLDNLDGQGNGRGALDGQMRASCAGCHASDGRDLKYFNFSNLSIIERSKFHGLTQTDGEKIASYIRSLDIPIVAQARPWNPTYQPGPELDNRTAYEWAAGAGVDAILDEDNEIAPYLFPDGTSLDAVRNVVDRYATLNFRELPLNIPMPEWNQWLPIIHPDNAFDTSDSAIRSDYRGNNVGMPYYEKLYQDAENNPTPGNIGNINTRVASWLRRGGNCEGGAPWRALNGNVLESTRFPMPSINWNSCNAIRDSREALEFVEIAKRGLSAWASVKMWEVVHSNDLEQDSMTRGKRVCSDGRCIDASEPRGWVVDGRNVFDRPPHYTGTGQGRQYFTQNSMLGILESNIWYHLTMILNPGYRETIPAHYAYTYSHVELLQRYSGIDQGYRFWATMIKQRQTQTNGKYGIEDGLDLRTAQPYVYYGTGRNRTNTDTQSSVGQPLWGRLAQAMIEDFVEDANNATAQDWANANQNRKVQDRNSTDFSPCSGTCTFDLGEYQGRNTYRVIPELRNIGVADSAIEDLIDWGEKTWPRGPWDRVR